MPVSISRFLSDPALLGPDFAAPSWDPWKVTLKAAFGEKMTDEEIVRFRELAGRAPPTHRVRELWLAIGRRGGKDSVAATIASYLATYGDFKQHLRRGEKATILCLACDRTQAGIVFAQIKAQFETIPLLKSMLVSAKDEVIKLRNDVEIVVATNNFRAIRGRTTACVILDEVAFWRDENYASPDVEVLNAVLPSMITLRDAGAMVIGISTVHAKRGLLYQKISTHAGQPDDDVLAILAPSTAYNPTLTQPSAAAEIARAIALDPERGNSEWLSLWRADLVDMFDRDLIAAAVDQGVAVRAPEGGIAYHCFVDPSGGRKDSFTMAIAHLEGDAAYLDVMFERRPPFDDLDHVIADIARLARAYGIRKVEGDDYGAELTVAAFKRHHLTYEQSDLNRSEIYLNALGIFTSGRARLLDNERLTNQLCQLERRTSRGGHDNVDHPSSSHDDLANAACGALVLAAGKVGSDWMRHIGAALPGARRWIAGLPPTQGTAPSPMAAAVQRARTWHPGRSSQYQPLTDPPSWARGRLY